MDAPERPSPLPAHEFFNTSGSDNVAVSPQRGSALGHLAILGTGLVAIAFIPYCITRRQVSTLRRRIDEMGATTALLKQRQAMSQVAPGIEPEATASGLLAQMRQELTAMREQLEQKDSQRVKALSEVTTDVLLINTELHDLRGDISKAAAGSSLSGSQLEPLEDGLQGLREQMETYRGEINEEIRQLRAEQESLRSALFKLSDEVQSAKTGPQSSDLQQLLLETRHTRAVVFGDLPIALGDIAYVIQRLDIEMGHEPAAGYDPVERLRLLALRMQDESYQAGGGRHK
ncbi:hypothetical protein K438DRAFT_1958537 [Mycena galopus ATCC 62051]|nr:hypothetical protein K438DRAFT_1958537 [Mycena galopus ATCC 62051]